MAAPYRMYACLLAVLVTAGAMHASAGISRPSLGRGPSCSATKDGSGFGGSHAHCAYSCGPDNALGIGVMAADKDASTYGNTTCGGAAAGCALQAPACTGVSPGLTSSGEDAGACDGYSDEFWSSPVTVVCVATNVDPKGSLCDIDQRLCKASASGPSVAALCLRSDPSMAGWSWVPEALAGVQGRVTSLVALHAEGDSLQAFRYDLDSLGATCVGQAL